MPTNFNRDAGQVTWTNATGSDVSAGDVVVIGHRIGIAAVDIDNGDSGVLYLTGIFTLAANTSTAFTVGQALYWDATNEELSTTEAENNFAGYCDYAKASATATAKVEINGPNRKKVENPTATNFVRASGYVTWTNATGSDVSDGDVVNLTNRIGIAGEDIANGESGTVYITGVYSGIAANTSTAFAVGDQVYWDVADEELNKTSNDNIPAGTVVVAKAEAGATATIDLSSNRTLTAS